MFCGRVVNKYSGCALKAWHVINEKIALNTSCKLSRIQVFGELFGGRYNGLPPVQGIKAIQKHVNYCDRIEFVSFDIHYSVVKDGKTWDRWMNYDQAMNVLEESGFPYLKPLFRGTFEEAMAHPHEFQSTIPAMLGMPPLEKNPAEGVVIKPTENVDYPSGQRFILKHKTDFFNEKSKPEPLLKTSDVSEKCLELLSTVESYATLRRLENVYSKFGNIGQDQLLPKFKHDILNDFYKEHGLEALESKERRFFHVHLRIKCSKIIAESGLLEKTEDDLL